MVLVLVMMVRSIYTHTHACKNKTKKEISVCVCVNRRVIRILNHFKKQEQVVLHTDISSIF